MYNNMSRYQCLYCPETFLQSQGMSRHIKKFHKHKLEDKFETKSDIKPNPPIVENKQKIKIKLRDYNKIQGNIVDHSITNDHSVTNNDNRVTINNDNRVTNIIIKQYYFNGKDLYDMICKKKGGNKNTYDYLTYNMKNIDLFTLIKDYIIDPPDGKSSLDLVDAHTISMLINKDDKIYDTDGKELEKQTKRILDAAYGVANIQYCTNFEELHEQRAKYAILSNKCNDPKQEQLYERKLGELQDELTQRSSTDSFIGKSLVQKNVADIKKKKLEKNQGKLIRNDLGKICIKEGRFIPGLQVSF